MTARRAGWGLLLVIAAATVASLVVPGTAGAETSETRRATAANWYWRAQQLSPVDGSPVLHDPKDADHGTTLVVSGPTAGGEADRFAVLGLDVGDVRVASVRQAMLVVPTSEAIGVPTGTGADGSLNDAGALPVLVVCATRGQWADGLGGRPASEAPAVDCATSARALPGPDGAYRVHLGTLLGQLIDGTATGLALVPDLDQPSPYELRLGPRSDIGLDLLTEAADEGPPPPTVTTLPPPVAGGGGIDLGGVAAPSPAPGPTAPAPAAAAPAPTGQAPPGLLGFGSTAPIGAPLAVFVLLAVIGAVALLFLSPSLV